MKHKILIALIALIGFSTKVQAQDVVLEKGSGNKLKVDGESIEETFKKDPNRVFDVVENMPSFPGGYAEMTKWIASNINYPADAAKKGIEGRVLLDLIVEPDGCLSDIKITRGVEPSLDKEAVDVIKRMPKWNPGSQNGICVRVRYIIPVTFKLSKQ